MTEQRGGASSHVPVLLEEVVRFLAPKAGGVYVDATFGAGGYTSALLEIPDTIVYAMDRDCEAIRDGEKRFSHVLNQRFFLKCACFSEMSSWLSSLGVLQVDGIVFDLGVSSMQIDRPRRGFSFLHDGPLDMRMGEGGVSAQDVVNTYHESVLADIFYRFGEEKKSRAIAREIVRRRANIPFSTTGQLSACIVDAYGGAACLPKRKTHPATKTFQALRIYINDELGELTQGLLMAPELLAPLGRLVVVTFHSLEDRLVKRAFIDLCGKKPHPSRHRPFIGEVSAAPFVDLVSGGCVPSHEECEVNPRARSARLRGIVKR